MLDLAVFEVMENSGWDLWTAARFVAACEDEGGYGSFDRDVPENAFIQRMRGPVFSSREYFINVWLRDFVRKEFREDYQGIYDECFVDVIDWYAVAVRRFDDIIEYQVPEKLGGGYFFSYIP